MRVNRLALLALVLLAAACAGPRPDPAPTISAPTESAPPSPNVPASPGRVQDARPAIYVAAGLSPRMTLQDVADLVITRIHRMEREAGRVVKPPRILSIRAFATQVGVQWQVEAEGTFTSHRALGLSTSSSLPVAASGHFVVLDADATVIGFGFP
jgi:hypothetical protein